MKPKILITDSFLEPAAKLISPMFEIVNYWEIKESLREPKLNDIRGMITTVWDCIDADFISSLPNLEIISHMGIGVDSIDLSATKTKNIVVANTPDVVTQDTADLAFGLLLALARNILINDQFVRESLWAKNSYSLSVSLKNKTIGIVGLGRIGLEIAKRAEVFNMKIAYWGRSKKEVKYEYFDSLFDLAQKADFLVISCSGNNQTKHLINADILKALGRHSYLINVARGFIVHQQDLINALEHKQIAGVGLDVYENEPNVPDSLLKMNNVVLQPHAGTATVEARNEMYQLVANNILTYFQQGFALTPVV